uniref:Uncharacterized protein n=1 Tax=Panagrolaimus sp. ES5 TaxID=591445 RepID=A0AC34GY67_9BILA
MLESDKPLFADELFADGKAEGTPDGNDLILRGNGEINLTLFRGELQFEVCKDCEGTSKVCFDSTERNIASTVKCSGFSSYCKFKVKYDVTDSGYEKIFFGDAFVFKDDFQCLQPTMKSGLVQVVRNIKFESCEPNIVGVDKMIKLYVNIDRSCSIRVLNAKVYAPEIPSTPLPSKSKPNDQSTDPSWTASFPWWLILIIVLVVIAVVLGIGGLAYYLYKKRQSSKIPPPTEVVPKPTVTNASVATLETPSKRKHDLNFTQFEPSKKSKKSQKKKDKKKRKQQTTQEPTTTEDAPAPHVTVPPAPIQPIPTSSVPYPKRIIPRSLKSVKTDSLDETTKSDKLAMIESAPVSFHHHCVKPADADLLEEMNENYPGNIHVVAKSEVDLLCSPVSKMYASINEFA